MSGSDSDDVDPDPWLTVAEVAAERRLNPATIRLWISKAKLPATRAGRRKLLIRRSDLDQMLELTQSENPAGGHLPQIPGGYPGRRSPPLSYRHLSTADIHGVRPEPGEMEEIIMGISSQTRPGTKRALTARTHPLTRAFPIGFEFWRPHAISRRPGSLLPPRPAGLSGHRSRTAAEWRSPTSCGPAAIGQAGPSYGASLIASCNDSASRWRANGCTTWRGHTAPSPTCCMRSLTTCPTRPPMRIGARDEGSVVVRRPVRNPQTPAD